MSGLTSQNVSTQQLASDALALLSGSQSDPAGQGPQAAGAPLTEFGRNLIRQISDRRHKLEGVARQEELSLIDIVNGKDKLNVAQALRRHAFTLKYITSELNSTPNFSVHAEANKAQIELFLNSIRMSATVFQVNAGATQAELYRATNTDLHSQINRLRELCGIPGAPESMSELFFLLREIRDDGRWARELDEESLAHKRRLLNFRRYLDECIAQIKYIHQIQQSYGPYANGDQAKWHSFGEAYSALLLGAWAVAEWTAFKASKKRNVLPARKVNYIGALKGSFTTLNRHIKALGKSIGIQGLDAITFDENRPLSENSAAKGTLSFGRWAAMSERKANIYGLI